MVDVRESQTWDRKPSHSSDRFPRPRSEDLLVTAQGAHSEDPVGNRPGGPQERQAGQVRFARKKQAARRGPPRVRGKLMCSREHALNCPAGWLCGLPSRQPVPPLLSPPREAGTCIGASETPSVARALAYKPLPAVGFPLPCFPRGPSGAPNGTAGVNTQGGGPTEQESVRPGFDLLVSHRFSDHGWGN